MKKILLVDDNKISRSLLRTLIEDYAAEEKKKLVINEADNGVEAVMLCNNEHYDLILMDIMMPEMGGVEATKLIRANDSTVMIIAMSGTEKPEVKKEVLLNGAEDFIDKPINFDIFFARLDNYFALIESRRDHLSIHEGHNLHGHKTYARTISFFIKDHDVLAEFWEYYLLNTQKASPLLTDTIRVLYDIGSLGLKLNLKPHIWVEESDKNIYFTMEGLSELNPNFIQSILDKNLNVTNVKLKRNKISFLYPFQQNTIPAIQPIKTTQASIVSIPHEEPVYSESTLVSADENHIYDYMDDEDLENINEYLSRLNTLLLIVGSGDICSEEVEEIAYYIDRIGRTTLIYSESYTVARALGALSSTIQKNLQIFIDKSSSLGLFCKTFGLDLMNWIQMVFHDGAPNVNFMDDTIISNAQMLESMLIIAESANETVSVNDIFDF
ncbi:MAG: response regulator [Sulfurimonas sp.]|nr:response regulator [Sulfurimonas sp.]